MSTPLIIKVYEDDTLSTIALKYNVTIPLIQKFNNNIESVSEGDRLVIPFSVRHLHIVRPLETLCQIAKRYEISQEKLIKDNDLKGEIFIGQHLLIL